MLKNFLLPVLASIVLVSCENKEENVAPPVQPKDYVVLDGENGSIEIECDIELDYGDLPSVIQEYLEAEYPGFEFEAETCVDEDGNLYYEVEAENEDEEEFYIYFDADGNVLSVESDDDGDEDGDDEDEEDGDDDDEEEGDDDDEEGDDDEDDDDEDGEGPE